MPTKGTTYHMEAYGILLNLEKKDGHISGSPVYAKRNLANGRKSEKFSWHGHISYEIYPKLRDNQRSVKRSNKKGYSI